VDLVVNETKSMKQFIIIIGKSVSTIRKASIEKANDYAKSINNESKEITVREIDSSLNLWHRSAGGENIENNRNLAL
jgi:hypothetical protein